MPQYTYQCESCQGIEEVIKSISEFEREEKCAECNVPMKRMPATQTSFVLKGTGWAKDLYANKKA